MCTYILCLSCKQLVIDSFNMILLHFYTLGVFYIKSFQSKNLLLFFAALNTIEFITIFYVFV